mmetsp:Transcript_21693/g.33434  ORF Transcript_21693/g.33434 Transcript_21693/m.33434 type:complete len:202 (+) Transcript_21693:474-1079(+)
MFETQGTRGGRPIGVVVIGRRRILDTVGCGIGIGKLMFQESCSPRRTASQFDDLLSKFGLAFPQGLRCLFHGLFVPNVVPESLFVFFEEASTLFANGGDDGLTDLELFGLETGNVQTLVQMHQTSIGLVPGVSKCRTSATTQNIRIGHGLDVLQRDVFSGEERSRIALLSFLIVIVLRFRTRPSFIIRIRRHTDCICNPQI